MKIGIIGSGQVAQTLGTKLVQLGHEVMISSRNVNAEKTSMMGKLPSANQWKTHHGKQAHAGSFSEAAKFGDLLLNCTTGMSSLDALKAAGKDNLKGKILIDVANPLDFSKGMPPTLAFCNTESLGERIQHAFPETKVIKVLNTVAAPVMVNPKLIPGAHDLFMAGNDHDAKLWVNQNVLEKWFGWEYVIDLGDITAARATEMYLPLWMRLFGKIGNPHFNVKVVR